MKLKTTRMLMVVFTIICTAMILLYYLVYKLPLIRNIGILSLFLEVCLAWKFWRCPFCDKGLRNQSFGKGKEVFCPYCQKLVEPDDMIEW